MRRTMREAWHLVKRTAWLGTTKYGTRLSQTCPIIMTVAAQHLQTPHTHWVCASGHVVIGLGAVLWISIPAAASMVTPKKTNEHKTAHRQDTLKQLGSSIWWTATERVQLATECELVAETKVSKFDVLIAIHQQILRLQTYVIIRHSETCF